MKDAFAQYLRTHLRLSEAESQLLRAGAEMRILRRDEQLLAAGEVATHKIFVLSGLLRVYTLAADGTEVNFYFLPELTWTTLDIESYQQQIPASYYVSAIEPTHVTRWPKRELERLHLAIPALRSYTDQLMQRRIYLGKQRLITALIGSSAERYHGFVREYPTLLPRLSLQALAAYLGMSVKTLTRIRRAQRTD